MQLARNTTAVRPTTRRTTNRATVRVKASTDGGVFAGACWHCGLANQVSGSPRRTFGFDHNSRPWRCQRPSECLTCAVMSSYCAIGAAGGPLDEQLFLHAFNLQYRPTPSLAPHSPAAHLHPRSPPVQQQGGVPRKHRLLWQRTSRPAAPPLQGNSFGWMDVFGMACTAGH